MVMRFGNAMLRARLIALLAGAALALTFTASASAAGGVSTPGVNVMASNPSSSTAGSDLAITLTAHTGLSTVPNPSCRPQDMTLECWGSLVLRIPKFGDLSVGDFQVHRVAVGDIACGDEGSEDDGCGDHEAGGMAVGVEPPVQAQVNGVAVVKWSGNTGLPVGTKVQLKFTLTDNGRDLYQDQVVVQVNLFTEGPDKPLLYRSGPETIRQVSIQFVDDRP